MVTKSDFVLEWDKALGFRGDPFADKIFGPINTFLVDRKDEKEKLNWFFIKNYFYGTLLGEPGVGKTILLKWLEDRLAKYNRIHAIYINAAIFKEQVNILHKMIMPLLTIYEKLVTKPHTKLYTNEFLALLKKKLRHKSVALLIDNAHFLTEKNLDLIKSLRKEGLKLQVLVTSTPTEYEKSRLGEIGHDELSITLRRPTFDESKEIIQRRAEAFGGKGLYPFSEEDLKLMYDKADKNPKEFIKLCRDEAIKILIHKREQLEMQAYAPVKENLAAKEAKALKTSPKKIIPTAPASPIIIPVGDKMDIKIRKADDEEIKEEKKEDKKRLIRIKFAFGKDEEKPRKQPQPMPFVPIQKPAIASKKDDKKAIYDDDHKEALVNKLSSTSPRRKFQEPVAEKKKEEKYISETDKLLRELADEFEMK